MIVFEPSGRFETGGNLPMQAIREAQVIKQSLSPKELAEAVGVSESSLKRWVDAGRLRAERTPGGHRRITVQEAVRFARQSQLPLVRPELLGLTDLSASRELGSRAGATDEDHHADDLLFDALRDGRDVLVRGLIGQWYLDGTDVAAIFDGPLRQALHRVGEIWQHDPAGVFLEHRAADIAMQAINQLRTLIRPDAGEHPAAPPPSPSPAPTPVAVGGAPSGDPYLIPSLMAACVLADAGFEAMNLGPDTPIASMKTAADHQQAQLVWLSCSATKTALPDAKPLNDLANHLAARQTPLIVGGRTVPNFGATRPTNLHVCHSMAELAAFARGLKIRQAW